jgi:hypothetical protein
VFVCWYLDFYPLSTVFIITMRGKSNVTRVVRCTLLLAMVLAILAWIPVVKSSEEEGAAAATNTDERSSGEASDAETSASVPTSSAEEATTTTTSPTGSEESSSLPPLVDEAASPLPKETIIDEPEVPKKPKRKPDVDDFFNIRDHTDWGTYYDPQNVFCGKFDCYKILGFDYESFGKKHPDRKVITKRYRSLSREWHPDKSKHKDAKERFVVRSDIDVFFLASVFGPLKKIQAS